MFSDLDDVWDEFEAEPSMEFIDAGEHVVTVGRMLAKGKGSGIDVEQFSAAVWTLRDGRVIRWELGHEDRQSALEAAGLRNQPRS